MMRPVSCSAHDVAATKRIEQGVTGAISISIALSRRTGKPACRLEPLTSPKVRSAISRRGGGRAGWRSLAVTLLKWALIFLVISIIAGILGFTGVSAASADIARVLFYIFVVIFLVLLILGLTIFRV
jgi:uncharacterized membrane protein YtjA (UPF0391 family)